MSELFLAKILAFYNIQLYVCRYIEVSLTYMSKQGFVYTLIISIYTYLYEL
jgi:hypothetical protein